MYPGIRNDTDSPKSQHLTGTNFRKIDILVRTPRHCARVPDTVRAGTRGGWGSGTRDVTVVAPRMYTVVSPGMYTVVATVTVQ